MRILIISQWFQPEPAFRGIDFAKALNGLGHDVQVLTGFPNYPGGRIYAGYRLRLFKRETMAGIPLIRSFLYPSHDRSAFGRTINYASFAISTLFVAFFLKKPDVVYLYTPPMTAALSAMVLRIVRRVPYVVDVQDLWPETLAATGMVRNKMVLKLVGNWTNMVLRLASGIVVLSDGFYTNLQQRGIGTRMQVIFNWAPPGIALLAKSQSARQDPDPRFRVLFAGNMGMAQGIETIIEAARLLDQRGIAVRFDMIGGGVDLDRLKAAAAAAAPGTIRFHPARPPEEMGEMFAEADALLVHLRPDPLFAITIPSKTQAYLSIGKPILMGVRGDAARMIEESRSGIAFDPGSPTALADAVGAMRAMSPAVREEMGREGRSYYQDKLAFHHGVAAIARELELAATALVDKPNRADP